MAHQRGKRLEESGFESSILTEGMRDVWIPFEITDY